ncbi:MAG: ABC transporter ATP-binding protein [Bacilli bacterium]|nr:ABC transporter ATP-binding protein [Bacilli bacterium]
MKSFKKLFLNFKKIWPYAKNNKKDMIIDIVGMFLLSIIGFITPYLSAKLIIYITSENFDRLIQVAIIIFFIEIVRNTFNMICSKFFSTFYHNSCTNLRLDILNKALSLETFELDNNSSGVFIDRINRDAGNIPAVLDKVENLIFDFIMNIGILVTVFIINKILFLYIIIAVAIIFSIEKVAINKRYEIDKKRRQINEKITALIGESIRGIRDIKVLNADLKILTKSKEDLVDSMNKTLEMNKINYRYRWFSGGVKDLYQLFLIVLGVYLINNHLITLSNFIIIFMYRDRIQNLLTSTINMAESLKDFNVSFDRVFEIIDGKKFKKESFGKLDLEQLNGKIEFKHLIFSYKESPTLDNLSFTIRPNQIVAFVGKTGSGKSTIFNLINRLYSVEDNMLFLDNNDINLLNKNSIRNNISLITQNPYLFNFSIIDNLKIVNDTATLDDIKRVCKRACIDDFIESLPDKYDTIIGEGGVTLSGGQKQRLAIARALLKKSEIILFDEATSALDNETQKYIKQAIDNIKGEKTVLIIAHRLSTIVDADKIIVVEEGKKVGEGTHKELLLNNKIYKQLYETYE